MSALDCRQVRRQLAAYHDGELAMDAQVAVQAHLRGCPACLADRRRLAEVGTLLRASVAARVPEERGRIERHVLARLHAERQTSWPHLFHGLFEDLHLVWAAAGATAATVVILCAVVASMALALREQPLSMAAAIGAMASPGSDRNPVSVDGRMLLPRSNPDALVESGVMDREEAVFALAAVVTREGRVRNLELLTPDTSALPVEDRETPRAARRGLAGALRTGASRRGAGGRQPGLAGRAHDRAWQGRRRLAGGAHAAAARGAAGAAAERFRSASCRCRAWTRPPPDHRFGASTGSARPVATLFIASSARRMIALSAVSVSIVSSNSSSRESAIPSFG